jgi:hypothetical protein
MPINVKDVMDWEQGTMSPEREKRFFQKMVNDGSVWHLQGVYGRRAADLLNAGIIKHAKERHHDYYGNPLPTRNEMKKLKGVM